MPRALVSVADKAGLAPFAKGLAALGWELVASGGTAEAIAASGVAVRRIEDLGGSPELLGGRIKTLQAHVHAAILARPDRPEDGAELRRLGAEPIGLVCVNLSPFRQRPAAASIDVGGVALLRAAASNCEHVVAVCRPADYDGVLEDLRAGGPGAARRRALALAAFRQTATYDASVAAWLAGGGPLADLSGEQAPFPEDLPLGFLRATGLRYGENPHQRAALYRDALPCGPSLLDAKQLQGPELSYNNLLDAEAAWDLVWRLEGTAAVAIKHGGPCGAALGRTAAEAFAGARGADPAGILRGTVAWNRPLDAEAAAEVGELRLQALIAPEIGAGAAAALRARQGLRVLVCPPPDPGRPLDYRIRRVSGGLLVQDEDRRASDPRAWPVATRRAPSPAELADLALAWQVARAAASNAAVVAAGGRTASIAAGWTDRTAAARAALERAGDRARGAVLASDGLLAGAEIVQAAAAAGITAIVQPGGGPRGEEAIRACDAADVAMALTGRRHFRH